MAGDYVATKFIDQVGSPSHFETVAIDPPLDLKDPKFLIAIALLVPGGIGLILDLDIILIPTPTQDLGETINVLSFENASVDYTNSTGPVFVDLALTSQHGGFAEGDLLDNVFSVRGSAFNHIY